MSAERHDMRKRARHIRPHRRLFPDGADHAAAGHRRASPRRVRRARDAARGGAADQRDDGERADSVSRRVGAGRGADGGRAGRAGVVADRRHRARDVGLAAGPRHLDGAIQGGHTAHRGAGATLRHGQFQCRLAAQGPGRPEPADQAQGHRRRAHRYAHAVQQEPRDRRLRPGARCPQHREPISSASPARAR